MEGKILDAIQNAARTIASPNCVDILSAFLSFLAIIVAGFVAWRQNKISKQQANIAEQQNKIAVFDKRYMVYDAVSKLRRVCQVFCVSKFLENGEAAAADR